ncbi:YlqD family protein [Melghiribacillus thermohalophilus]|nr:YlqD family protein [Melghiribacillus thermohalophilus]
MKIVRKTAVKQVLTEKSKELMREKFSRQRSQLENECRQLDFEKRKLQNKKGISQQEVHKRFQKEIERRENQIKWLDYKLEQLNLLPPGSEITEGEVDEIIEVHEGDNWKEMMGERSIIIKDGIVIRIE